MKNRIVLTDKAFSKLQGVLDNPPEATQALKDLMNINNFAQGSGLKYIECTPEASGSLDDLTLDEVVKTLLQASQELYEVQEKDALEYLINQSLIDVKERNTLTLDELIDSI